MTGDYQNTVTTISDSNFTMNSATQGGVFSVKDSSKIECSNCRFEQNFAISSAVVFASAGGYYEFTGSSILNNIALSVPISEMVDVSA